MTTLYWGIPQRFLKTQDFSYRTALGRPGPVIVWVRLGNCRNATLLAAFERTLPSVERAIQQGEKLIEIV
jgi:predicted nuclease of predicted toxin-antitoxin system